MQPLSASAAERPPQYGLSVASWAAPAPAMPSSALRKLSSSFWVWAAACVSAPAADSAPEEGSAVCSAQLSCTASSPSESSSARQPSS